VDVDRTALPPVCGVAVGEVVVFVFAAVAVVVFAGAGVVADATGVVLVGPELTVVVAGFT
jgi:hypothetical protein